LFYFCPCQLIAVSANDYITKPVVLTGLSL